MKIKHVNLQKWFTFWGIIIPIILANMGLFAFFEKTMFHEELIMNETKMRAVADYFYETVQSELDDLSILNEGMSILKLSSDQMLNLNADQENYKMYFSDDALLDQQRKDMMDRILKIYKSNGQVTGLVFNPENDFVYLYHYNLKDHRIILSEYKQSTFMLIFLEPLGYEYIFSSGEQMLRTSSLDFNILESEPNLIQKLSDQLIFNTENEELGIKLCLIMTNVQNTFIESSMMLYVTLFVNLIVFLLISRIVNLQKYPLNKLNQYLEVIIKNPIDVLKSKPLIEYTKIETFLQDIALSKNDLIEQREKYENSCIKYTIEIDELLNKSKNLKKEHDRYLTEMYPKESINELVFNFIDQISFLINFEGVILEVNQAFENKLGYNNGEALGKLLTEILVEDTKTASDIIKLHDEPIYLNFKMNGENSRAFQFLNVKIIHLVNGNYLCIGKSINDELTLQSRILRKNRELEYINQINSSLISNWGINELLENIIHRIDYLFNVVTGNIRTRDEYGLWILKASTLKGREYHEQTVGSFYTDEDIKVLEDSEIKIIPVSEETRVIKKYPEELKYILYAPLEVDGEIIAILSLGLEAHMTTNDLNILKMFKNQASVVIQRALLYDELRNQYFNTIQSLVNVIEAKDKYTEGHSRRVSRFSVEIAKEMGYSNEELENIEIAGLLHDVGKVGISQSILTKQGKLSNEEYEIIKEHPEKGIHILKSIKLDQQILEGILYHHVRYDLRGYPASHDLRELPLYSSIIGAADAFDAITSARSYSVAETIDEGFKELSRNKGTQFHPQIIDAFERLVTHHKKSLQMIIDDVL